MMWLSWPLSLWQEPSLAYIGSCCFYYFAWPFFLIKIDHSPLLTIYSSQQVIFGYYYGPGTIWVLGRKWGKRCSGACSHGAGILRKFTTKESNWTNNLSSKFHNENQVNVGKKLMTDVSMEILSTWTGSFIFSIILPKFLVIFIVIPSSPLVPWH